MLKIKFLLLSKRQHIVTGGHKYEKDLIEVIKKISGIDFQYAFVGSVNSPFFLKPFIETYNILERGKTNILLINSSSCLRLLLGVIILKFFTKGKIYGIHHHFIYLTFKGFKKWLFKIAESIFLHCSNKIIIPSPYIYEELKKYKNEKDLLLWRIPFDTKRKLDVNPIVGNLTYAGTIEPRKGLMYLMEALKKLQEKGINYHLNIMGKVIDKNYYQSLIKYIESYKLKVSFLGFVEIEEKDKILSETDVFVFPSFLEGFGMVLIEAQVYGLPIVCFDISAMPFTVKNGINGFTIPPFDTTLMALKIGMIINDRTLRTKLSEGAYKNLDSQWSYKKFENTVEDYFDKLIRK